MTGLFCEACGRDLDSAEEYETVVDYEGKPQRIGIECCG